MNEQEGTSRQAEYRRQVTERGQRDGWTCPRCGIPMIPPGMETEFEFPEPEWSNAMMITTDEAYPTLNPRGDGLLCHRCNAVATENAEAGQ